jgi:Pyruvate/2-oxoacid:ferredoxin oxidoreductase delta subunit
MPNEHNDKPYLKLQKFLDQFPIGFPATESGVEIEILKRLFTEQEAELTTKLSPMPEEASQIAERADIGTEGLEEKLEAMSKKGLVFRVRRHGKALFSAAPFMIGLYEYSINIIDKELAALFKEYYDIAYLDEMGAGDVPGFKIVPVEENIQPDSVLMPFHKLKEDIRGARKIAVADCVCRKEADLLDHGCDHPMQSCLSFGVAAEYYIENGMGREVTPEEAIRIVEEADESGLVHASANSRHLSNICNCCPCCCASMKGITAMGHDKRKYMNAMFEAVVDEEACTACEVCVDRCPVEAIEVGDAAVIDIDKCLGCGLCAGTCPAECISMKLRENAEEPFGNVFELGMAILEGKEKKRGAGA